MALKGWVERSGERYCRIGFKGMSEGGWGSVEFDSKEWERGPLRIRSKLMGGAR